MSDIRFQTKHIIYIRTAVKINYVRIIEFKRERCQVILSPSRLQGFDVFRTVFFKILNVEDLQDEIELEYYTRGKSREHALDWTKYIFEVSICFLCSSNVIRSTGLWRACTAMQIILPGGWVSQPFLWRRQIRPALANSSSVQEIRLVDQQVLVNERWGAASFVFALRHVTLKV